MLQCNWASNSLSSLILKLYNEVQDETYHLGGGFFWLFFFPSSFLKEITTDGKKWEQNTPKMAEETFRLARKTNKSFVQ